MLLLVRVFYYSNKEESRTPLKSRIDPSKSSLPVQERKPLDLRFPVWQSQNHLWTSHSPVLDSETTAQRPELGEAQRRQLLHSSHKETLI